MTILCLCLSCTYPWHHFLFRKFARSFWLSSERIVLITYRSWKKQAPIYLVQMKKSEDAVTQSFKLEIIIVSKVAYRTIWSCNLEINFASFFAHPAANNRFSRSDFNSGNLYVGSINHVGNYLKCALVTVQTLKSVVREKVQSYLNCQKHGKTVTCAVCNTLRAMWFRN